MKILTLIIRREFMAKVRNKSFIVMTFLSPLLFVGIATFVAYLSSMKADVKDIALYDQTGMFVSTFKSDDEYRFTNVSGQDLQLVRDSVKSGFYQGMLFIPQTESINELKDRVRYISNDSPNLMFLGSIERAISDKLTTQNYIASGLDTLKIKDAEAQVNIALEKSSGEESVKGLNEIKIAIGSVFGYLIMMFIIIYGNMVMRSVIEEKTNRIIEIIISSVKPFQLMMGKIIGTSLAGVLQFLIWAVLGIIIMLIASASFGVSATNSSTSEAMQMVQQESGLIQLYLKELWALPIATILISFVVYFIGGYFLYSSFYAAIGAAVDNETDSQQFLLPIIMPLILAVYIGFFTVINDPHGSVATAFSFIPLTSPIVMLMRIPFGVPMWQLLLSIAILFGTFFLVVWVAAKIYRVGILMYGKKPTYKEMIRWLRY
jgi:ABC-2 type transport system permease protein